MGGRLITGCVMTQKRSKLPPPQHLHRHTAPYRSETTMLRVNSNWEVRQKGWGSLKSLFSPAIDIHIIYWRPCRVISFTFSRGRYIRIWVDAEDVFTGRRVQIVYSEWEPLQLPTQVIEQKYLVIGLGKGTVYLYSEKEQEDKELPLPTTGQLGTTLSGFNFKSSEDQLIATVLSVSWGNEMFEEGIIDVTTEKEPEMDEDEEREKGKEKEREKEKEKEKQKEKVKKTKGRRRK